MIKRYRALGMHAKRDDVNGDLVGLIDHEDIVAELKERLDLCKMLGVDREIGRASCRERVFVCV